MSLQPVLYKRENLRHSLELDAVQKIVDTTVLQTHRIAREVAKQFQEKNKIAPIENGNKPEIKFTINSSSLKFLRQITNQMNEKNEKSWKKIEMAMITFKENLKGKQIHLKIDYEKDWDQWKDELWFTLWEKRSTNVGLPAIYENKSCFEFVIIQLNLVQKMNSFLKEKESFDCSEIPNFLKQSGFKFGNLPLRENDVILYYRKKDEEPSHAAIVQNNSDLLLEKIGNKTPFASIHHIDFSPIEYGPWYCIFRKSE